MVIEIEEFIRITVAMPGLCDVYAGKTFYSYIYIPETYIKGQVGLFNQAYTRLHLISSKAGIGTILEAPVEKNGNYKLIIYSCKYRKEIFCQNKKFCIKDDTGLTVVDDIICSLCCEKTI